jgi:hypothetical protein
MMFVLACLVFAGTFPVVQGQNELKIWKEFVAALKNNALSPDRIRLIEPMTQDMIQETLQRFREDAVWSEWEAEPEIIRADPLLNFVIPLKGKLGTRTDYCFMFLVEKNNWYFRSVEAVFIRLDKIGSLPASTFPDISEKQKAWAREEIYWSEQVRLFNLLSKDKGKEFAFDWVKKGIGNGLGYLLGAETWVPFVPPSKAFILYLCWEQANLRGNDVVLEKLDDHEALLKITPLYFALYQAASHLKRQISLEDYIRIFETIWQERADKAGWKLKIEGQGKICIFHFTK